MSRNGERAEREEKRGKGRDDA
jgi:hypothetical protein